MSSSAKATHVQVSLAIARVIESLYSTGPNSGILSTIASLTKAEQASICSLGAFLIGLATFGRFGDRVGPHKRGWLFAGTLIQAALTLAAAFAFYEAEGSPVPKVLADLAVPDLVQQGGMNYFFGIACLSSSLGVQGIMARRLSTQFSTTSAYKLFAW